MSGVQHLHDEYVHSERRWSVRLINGAHFVMPQYRKDGAWFFLAATMQRVVSRDQGVEIARDAAKRERA